MSTYYFETQSQKLHGHRSIVLTIIVSILLHSVLLYKLNHYEAALWQDDSRPPQTVQPVKMSLLALMTPAPAPKVIQKKKPAVVEREPQPPKLAQTPDVVEMPSVPPVDVGNENLVHEQYKEAEEVVETDVVEETESLAQEDDPVENQTGPQPVQYQNKDSATTTSEISETALQATTSDYYAMIQQLVESNKHYPKVARRRRIEGEVKVSFVIRDDGTIEEVSSSGNKKVLNSAAEKAILAVSPLPKPPEVIATPIQLSFTMIFKLI